MAGDHSVNLVTSYDLFSILQTVLYFTDRHFKILNLYNIDLKFLGSISGVNNNNGAKFCLVTIPRCYLSRNEKFERFWTLQTDNLQTRYVISKFFADFEYTLGA